MLNCTDGMVLPMVGILYGDISTYALFLPLKSRFQFLSWARVTHSEKVLYHFTLLVLIERNIMQIGPIYIHLFSERSRR